MKWRGQRQSGNVEDRRGMSSGGKVVAGGGIIGVIVILLQMFGGESAQILTPVLDQMNQNGSPTELVRERELTPEEKEMGEFVATLLAKTEDVWTQVFQENELGEYRKPTLVLFSGSVETACGGASSASGPFYCPADEKVYMDMAFFEELRTRFGAKGGDFAIAYVVAHEIGHHVQNLLGTAGKVQQLQQRSSETEANQLSVALELQADFYAGLWAYYNKENLEVGDIEEAISAAHAVGDDAIQSRTQGHVVPDSFTHGSSEQRKKWFTKGYQTGDMRNHDTFAGL